MKKSIAVLALVLSALPAAAAPVIDPVGDFLPTYTGPKGGDLDVVSSEAFYDVFAQTFSVTATLNAAVGTTAGSFYVWGFNRGAGTERFVTGTPSVGAGVFFDSVLVLRADGTGQFTDIVGGVTTILPTGSVVISGSTISSVALSGSLFTSRGFWAEDYTWNLWPRVSTVAGNASISEFAPDASNALVTSIPEPTGLMGLGAISLVLGSRRRR